MGKIWLIEKSASVVVGIQYSKVIVFDNSKHLQLMTHVLIISFHFCMASCVGTYESGVARYKHVYFNATENTTKIWLLSVIAIIALYECTKQLIKLMLQKSVRYSMVILFVLSIFPHYYGWWMCFNYWNDDFYSQWNHQLFFTVHST